MSVSSLLLFPLSKGLFHRVIAQSGSSVSPYSCRRVMSTMGLDVFKKAIQCELGDHIKVMECLRGKSVDEILAAKSKLTKTMQMIGEQEYLTRPIVDGEYLPDDPETLLRKDQVHKADVMLGVTSHESAFFLVFFTLKAKVFDKELFKACIRPFLVMYGAYHHLGEEAVMMEYLGGHQLNDSEALRQIAIDVTSDLLFLAPTFHEGDLLLKTGNPVYMYVMDQQPHAPRLPKWLGSYHVLDLAYSFGLPLDSNGLTKDFPPVLPANFSALEEGFSKYVMKLWTNFAKYGNPNADGHMPVTWPQYDQEHTHLRLSTNPRIQRGLRERKVKFWTEFYPKVIGTEPHSEATGAKTKNGQKHKEEL